MLSAIPPSRADKIKDIPKYKQSMDVIIIANSPDKKTAGSISPVLPHRKATVKTANPKADPIAAKVPSVEPSALWPETIIEMAMIATNIAIQVAGRTRSRRKIQPRIAVIKGAVAKSSSALATGITWSE